ncbi:MAG: hypothetical protein BroJett030_29210 [Alphaproteobacteria bacterium]|nr:MAG: hypothetical protein BroJett030_29210 [Alphaproteobacteria bacterium]
MALQSMTGFARVEGRADGPAGPVRWTWELRSVNAKGLDIRLRLPPGFEPVEIDCRRVIAARLARGNIQASLRWEPEGVAEIPVVNRDVLDAVLGAVEELRRRLGSPPPAAEAILSIRGVMDVASPTEDEEAVARRNRAVLTGLERAVGELIAVRAGEGGQIVAVLKGHVEEIARLTAAVEADPSRSADALRARLAAQVALLAGSLDEERLYQEAAMLAARADLREELDRLNAHVHAAVALLDGDGPAGRKLDFLAQEFNRESNTICSKSNAAAVTRLGLEMKVVVDQFREQVQNLE